MHFLIYKTTCVINDKIYIGAHATHNIDDGYLGTGNAIKRAIKKYGKSSFTREILFYCSSEEEMYNKESEIVNEEFVQRTDTYNLIPGGRLGTSCLNTVPVIDKNGNVYRTNNIKLNVKW